MNRPLYAIAAEFCSWVEKREMQEDVGVWLSRILAELIHVVYCIPDDGLWDAGADEEDGYKGRDYQEVRNSLPNLPLQYYREVYDSTVLDDNDPVNGELHDDVADIYGDLKRGLFVHENISPAEAERYWRQSFRYHGVSMPPGLCARYTGMRRKNAGCELRGFVVALLRRECVTEEWTKEEARRD